MPILHQPIIQILEFPPTFLPLKKRIEESGYTFVDIDSPEAGLSVALAFAPLSVQISYDDLVERVQKLKQKHPQIPLLGAHFGRMRFKKNEAYFAGVQFLYNLPFEEEIFLNKLFEISPPPVEAEDLSLSDLMPINIIEIESATSIPFSLYLFLPYNQKILLYYQKDQKLDEERVKKFKANSQATLYIRRAEIKAYKKYCIDLVAGPGAGLAGLSEVEKRRKSGERLMGLMADFFNNEDISFEDSQMAVENLKGVVEGLETPGASSEVREQVSQLAAQRLTQVNHAQNVAAYCVLFGMAINQGDPTTLKLGGLLHDLGLSDMPPELIGQDIDKLPEEEAAKYKLHPGSGKRTIEERKIALPPGVLDMVLYHHERPDGSGYPYGKQGADIPVLAKICAFADEFDKLTSVRPGYRQLSPSEAVRRIAGLDGEKPSSVYEESLHRPLVDLILKPKSTPARSSRESATLGSVRGSSSRDRSINTSVISIRRLLETTNLKQKYSAGLSEKDSELLRLQQELLEHFKRCKAIP
jgi:HD-GYP domain-containing protein (c-di-GMP phosphodiesterase class II)